MAALLGCGRTIEVTAGGASTLQHGAGRLRSFRRDAI
jgi:hypothetical protein